MFESVLAALVAAATPAAVDAIRGGVAMLTGSAGAKPANVGEVIQLMEAETKRLKALAEIDKTGNVSQWVENVRAMQRPAAVAAILAGYLSAVTMGGIEAERLLQLEQLANMACFYLLGDRTYSYLKGKAAGRV